MERARDRLGGCGSRRGGGCAPTAIGHDMDAGSRKCTTGPFPADDTTGPSTMLIGGRRGGTDRANSVCSSVALGSFDGFIGSRVNFDCGNCCHSN